MSKDKNYIIYQRFMPKNVKRDKSTFPNMEDMNDSDFDKWLNYDLWYVGEFVSLALQKIPNFEDQGLYLFEHKRIELHPDLEPNWYHEWAELYFLTQRGIDAGKIKTTRNGDQEEDSAAPIEYISWALDKDIDLPQKMIDFITINLETLDNSQKGGAVSKRERRKLMTKKKHKLLEASVGNLHRDFPNRSVGWYADKLIKTNKNQEYKRGTLLKYISIK